MTTEAGTESWAIPPLFAHLVDDTTLLQPRTSAPDVDVVIARYLAARDGRYGGLVGQLVCPVSRLSVVVAEIAHSTPTSPVDISLVVDTGLGAVPKAMSTAMSRSGLLTPRSVETAAPPDVDAVWLERVSEFVPEDVVAVVEPRRPQVGDVRGTAAWLEAVRRVAGHGCAPKLRCGGPRAFDVPTTADVEAFVRVAAEAGCAFTVLGMRDLVRPAGGSVRHGVLNVLVAVSRALSGDDVGAAVESTDGGALAAEIDGLSEAAATGVRGLVARCGVDLEALPAAQLADLGLLA